MKGKDQPAGFPVSELGHPKLAALLMDHEQPIGAAQACQAQQLTGADATPQPALWSPELTTSECLKASMSVTPTTAKLEISNILLVIS